MYRFYSHRIALFVVLLWSLYTRTFGTSDDPCSVLGLAAHYDVIVVGAGVGGSVAARRLAEFGGGRLSVLLVEKGAYYSECPLCANLENYIDAGNSPITGPLLNFVPQTHIIGHPVLTVKEASIQGGGSAINGAVFARPDIRYFSDHYPETWNWNTMIPYFIETENYTFPNGFYGADNNFNYPLNLRGKHGLVTLTQGQASDGNGFTGKFIDSVKEVWPHIRALKNNSLNNGYFDGFGVAPGEHSYYNGVRSAAYNTYIDTYTGSNLRSIAHVRVNKILFFGTTARGVQLQFTNSSFLGNSSTCNVSSHTVVVSGGAFGTPKLLKLSGVGPRAELNALSIHVVLNQPEVGANLDDQFGISFFPTSGTTIVPSGGFHQFGVAFYNVEDDPFAAPNLAIDLSSFSGLFGPNISTAAIQAYLSYAESKGTVKLASSNPDDEPLVDPQYLSTLKDKLTLAVAVNKTARMIKIFGLNFTDPCETSDCSTLLKLLDVYLNQTLAPTVGYHWCGTASIGKVLDEFTMAIKGLNGVYVLDASALTVSPGQNPQSSIYAVSERGVQLIILDHLLKGLWT